MEPWRIALLIVGIIVYLISVVLMIFVSSVGSSFSNIKKFLAQKTLVILLFTVDILSIVLAPVTLLFMFILSVVGDYIEKKRVKKRQKSLFTKPANR